MRRGLARKLGLKKERTSTFLCLAVDKISRPAASHSYGRDENRDNILTFDTRDRLGARRSQLGAELEGRDSGQI